MAEGADEVFEEARAHSDLANRIHESCMAARKEVGGWLAQEWGLAPDVVYFISKQNNVDLSREHPIFSIAHLAEYLLAEQAISSPGGLSEPDLKPEIWPVLKTTEGEVKKLKRELKTALIVVNHVFPVSDLI